ncbi:hypothetical protein [Komagataeibacter sp. SM21]|uniref:hypothetical protein n=1 Tax=Komagataeibacter sp. SM21 TaxID=3242899 RepID=UPI00352783DD
MDRQIVYPAQIPLDSDQLNAQRNAYVGLGQFAGMAYGWDTVAASGFACAPGTGLAVIIAPGSLLAPGVVDGTSYGTLAPVSSALVRQYTSRDPLALEVPGTAATYTVYVTPVTIDGDAIVLPFYNAADPSVTYAGSDNTGATAPTVRQDLAQLGIGVSVPAGAYPLWTVTVPAGASAITADMLTQAAGAPFYDTIPQLQAAKQDALGFTPVQQGGGPDQTGDKVNLGQDTSHSGIMRVSINGSDAGGLLSGTYGKSAPDYQILGLYFQTSTGRPVAVFSNGTANVFNGIANYTDVTAEASAREAADTSIQTNLTNFQTSQAATNAEFSSDISDCVSGIYGKGAPDYQILGLYQQSSTGRPIVVFNDGTTTVYKGIANYADVTTLQTSLATFQTQQSDQNSTFSSEIAARVPTNATNDGTNAPITLMNYYLGTGIPWASANGISFSLVQTNPGTGFNQIKNATVYGESSALTVLDATGTTNTYAPSSSGTIAASGNITGGYWTKTGSILRQVIFLEKLIDNPVVTFPTAYSAVPCVTFGTSTEYTTQNTAFANIQRDTSDNLLLSATGCTLHISRGAPDVAVSGDGVDVWMTIEGPVSS